jgi:choline dehydrogenase-like flavoprotein
MAMDLDCLIVGGGAAGTAAAEEVAASGADVVVVEAGKTLAHRIDASNVTVLTSSLAWGAFPGGVVSVVTPGDSLDFAPCATILATGAEDRLLPFPGWEHRLVVTAAEAMALDQDVAFYAEASTADGVFVAGALAGLCGPETAALEGRLAGRAAAAYLGKRQGSAEAATLSRFTAEVRAARGREAQAPWITRMWELEDRYVREALHHSDGLLCRCERVPGAAVKAALADLNPPG